MCRHGGGRTAVVVDCDMPHTPSPVSSGSYEVYHMDSDGGAGTDGVDGAIVTPDDDEVEELAIAPVGSHVQVEVDQGGRRNGCVRDISPGGTRMLIDFDEGGDSGWVGADTPWELTLTGSGAAERSAAAGAHEESAPEAEADVDGDARERSRATQIAHGRARDAVDAEAEAETPEDADEDAVEVFEAEEEEEEEEEEEQEEEEEEVDVEGAVVLEEWKWNAGGSLTGYVYGKAGFRNGELITTSYVPPDRRFSGHVLTQSGTCYRLGTPTARDSVRRSGRASGKESALDAFANQSIAVPGAPHLSFSVGGAETGGVAAERIVRSAFSVLDDNCIMLRSQYACARRVVLFKEGVPVAAGVVELHPEHSIIEVPILAAAKSQRQQGHGSVLVALLMDIACRLRTRTLVVSATAESYRFWLRQGLHAPAHCAGAVRAALRKLDQGAVRRGFANSITLAMELPTQYRKLVSRVLRRLGRRCPAGRSLSAVEASAAFGYEDVNSLGNFVLQPDGRRVPVSYGQGELMAVNTPYSKLQAFPVGDNRGWGLRCSGTIQRGQVVLEARGRCLTEREYEELADPSFVISFGDKVGQMKQAAKDALMYIDLREQGNLMRFVHDCPEAPNLQLMYWPEPDPRQRVLPRRAFLVAKHDIPPLVELTWDYGRHYERHWLNARLGTGSGWASRVLTTVHDVSSDEDELIPPATGPGPATATDGAGTASAEELRDELVEELASMEDVLPWRAMRGSWRAEQPEWLAQVQAAESPSQLAACLSEVEFALHDHALRAGWFSARPTWRDRLAKLQAMQEQPPRAAFLTLRALLRELLQAVQPAYSGGPSAPNMAAGPTASGVPRAGHEGGLRARGRGLLHHGAPLPSPVYLLGSWRHTGLRVDKTLRETLCAQ